MDALTQGGYAALSGSETEIHRQGEDRRDELQQTCNARAIWRSKPDDRTRRRRFRRDRPREKINISRVGRGSKKSALREQEFGRAKSFVTLDQHHTRTAPHTDQHHTRQRPALGLLRHQMRAILTPGGGYYDTRCFTTNHPMLFQKHPLISQNHPMVCHLPSG